MASADDDRGASGPHLFRIPQNCTVRVSIPPHVRLVRGPNGQLQMIPTGAPIPINREQVPGAVSNPILEQLHAQQRERMEKEEQLREKKSLEEKQRNEKLKSKLAYNQPPQVEFTSDVLTAKLVWEKKELISPEDLKNIVYTVLLYTDDKPEIKKIYSGQDNSCVVGEGVLTRGHSYHFTVTASFGELCGDPSPKASIVVPPQAPSKPLPPKVANRTKNALTLRWNAPQDNGAPITHYDLEWDQCTGEWQHLVSDKAKQYKLTQKLPPATVAQFRVKAFNSVGDRLRHLGNK